MQLRLLPLYSFFNFLLLSCNNDLECERHYIPEDFIGKVTIYYDQKRGQGEFDNDGCRVYRIEPSGNCYVSFPYKQGAADPNETYQFFEIIKPDSVNRIFEFYERDYLKDTATNKKRKYVFFHSSGYSSPNYTFEYYVDYAMNYKKHLYY